MRDRIVIFLFLCVFFAGCRSGNGSSEKIQFPYAEPPSLCSNPTEYVALHFWDRYFAECPEISTIMLKEAFAKYAQVAGTISLERGIEAQEQFIKHLASYQPEKPEDSVWNTFISLQKAVFFSANSPLRNEDLYVPVAEYIAKSPLSSEEERAQAESILPFIRLNGAGSKAANFSITFANGTKRDLYSFDTEYIILMFSNVGCDACKNEIEKLQSFPLRKMWAEGRLSIITVYPDEDIAEWRKNVADYPAEWCNGYDSNHTIISESLYYLRAIPSIYILDKDKRVLGKDVPAERIFSILLKD